MDSGVSMSASAEIVRIEDAETFLSEAASAATISFVVNNSSVFLGIISSPFL